MVFRRGAREVILVRNEAVQIRDWSTGPVGEFALHAKLNTALEQKPEPAIIDLPTDDLYEMQAALVAILNVIEEKQPPLTSAQQQLRTLAQVPPLARGQSGHFKIATVALPART